MPQVYANYALQGAAQQRLCITKTVNLGMNEPKSYFGIKVHNLAKQRLLLFYQAWLPSEDVVLRNMSDSNP